MATYDDLTARLLAGRQGNRNTVSDRARSPTVASEEEVDEIGGVRLDGLSVSGSTINAKYTAPHARVGVNTGSSFAQILRATAVSPVTRAPDVQGDDVFTTPAQTIRERREERAPGSSTSQLEITVPEQRAQLRPTSSNLTGRNQIGGVDAQQLYPPAACIFVANLPEPKDDTALEVALSTEFMKYGTCFIKIRRDSSHMPFAFIQYTKETEAREALRLGRGAIIFGRACRTEMVKANRHFIVQRKQGPAINVDEARDLLSAFGTLNKCDMLHEQVCEPMGYPPTVLAEFSMFDASRDLQASFRNHAVYNVNAFDLKKNTANAAVGRSSQDENFLNDVERTRRSIFVGDLPPGTTREEMEALFSESGVVISANVISRGVQPGYPRTMAFVEFSQANMPDNAIRQFHGSTFNGSIIRVERKTFKDRGLMRQPRSTATLADIAIAEVTSLRPSNTLAPDVLTTPVRRSEPVEQPNSAGYPPPFAWPYSGVPQPVSPYTTTSISPYHTPVAATGPTSGILPTPHSTPHMVNQYPYYGSYWPGVAPMGYGQEGMYPVPYYPYPMPGMAVTATPDEQAETPTRRAHGQEDVPGRH